MKNRRSEYIVAQAHIYSEQIKCNTLAAIHGYLFKIYIIKEVVGSDIFPNTSKI